MDTGALLLTSSTSSLFIALPSLRLLQFLLILLSLLTAILLLLSPSRLAAASFAIIDALFLSSDCRLCTTICSAK